MGVPSNHPIYRWIFHEKKHPSLGIPHLWNPPKLVGGLDRL